MGHTSCFFLLLWVCKSTLCLHKGVLAGVSTPSVASLHRVSLHPTLPNPGPGTLPLEVVDGTGKVGVRGE